MAAVLNRIPGLVQSPLQGCSGCSIRGRQLEEPMNLLPTTSQPASVSWILALPPPSPARERERVTDSLNNNNNNNIIPTGVIYISIHQSGYRHFINDLGRQKAPKTGTLFCCRDVSLVRELSEDREEMALWESRGCWTGALRRLD